MQEKAGGDFLSQMYPSREKEEGAASQIAAGILVFSFSINKNSHSYSLLHLIPKLFSNNRMFREEEALSDLYL